MSKKITLQQVAEKAKEYNVPLAALRAVMEIEAKGSGFNTDGSPVILFERHIFRRRLVSMGLTSLAASVMKSRPDLCNTSMGGYGKYSQQHNRMGDAAKFNRVAALESASWGLGQVMGFHWKDLGYVSLQAFINAMYADEASQLDAMLRYIKRHKLDVHMRAGNWAKFALGYNGPAYKVNQYDVKLAAANRKFI